MHCGRRGWRSRRARTRARAQTHLVLCDSCLTVCSVGIYRDGHVDIVPNDQGNRITPSYVAWDGEERLVGDAAKNQATVNPQNTVFDVKRLIGRNFEDKTVQADMKLWYVARRRNSHVRARAP
ncbi:hypothetical protein EON67_05555 [archaeon]|nr:MAG: hypothetical protein EON67_05555 [archaeon]